MGPDLCRRRCCGLLLLLWLLLNLRGRRFVTATARLAQGIWLLLRRKIAPRIGVCSVCPLALTLQVPVDLEMLVQGSPVGIILGTFVALEPALGQSLSVLGVGVVVKLFEIFVLEENQQDQNKKFSKLQN